MHYTHTQKVMKELTYIYTSSLPNFYYFLFWVFLLDLLQRRHFRFAVWTLLILHGGGSHGSGLCGFYQSQFGFHGFGFRPK